jgi:hypothetical protein
MYCIIWSVRLQYYQSSWSSIWLFILRICESGTNEPADRCLRATTRILHRFYDQIHRWFPVLHSEFPIHFHESNAAGFPPSTTSCVSLLVASLAHISYDNTKSSSFKAAISMLPIVIQEYSVTAIQCLVLFSLYSACLIQPRQAHDYIQSASLKMQPFLKK